MYVIGIQKGGREAQVAPDLLLSYQALGGPQEEAESARACRFMKCKDFDLTPKDR